MQLPSLKQNEILKGRIQYQESLVPLKAQTAGQILLTAAGTMSAISFEPFVLQQPALGSVILTIVQQIGFVDDGYEWKDIERSERVSLDASRSVEIIENVSGQIPGENITTIGRRRFKYHMNTQSSYLQLLQYFPVGDHVQQAMIPAYAKAEPKRANRLPCLPSNTTYSRLPKSFIAKSKLPERKALREIANERYFENYKLMHNVFYPQPSSGDVVDFEGGLFTKMLKGDKSEEEMISILQSKIDLLQQVK
eukprot:NODE_19_length_39463_cov_0.396073.p13 type:complete len:251 gc:universal NODE_19_length_39463_cov_0.396073:30733-29981(-)